MQRRWGWKQLMDSGPCGGKDGDVGSAERGRQGNQVAREQPRKRSRRRCRTCGGRKLLVR